jgi:hypothetical protein
MKSEPFPTTFAVLRNLLFAALLACAGTAAQAQGRSITAANAPDGSVVLTFHWQSGYCDGLYLPLPPTAVVTGASIAVTSQNHFFDCPAPPPVIPPPQAASVSVNVGFLPDGGYAVEWTFPSVFIGSGPPSEPPVPGAFFVQAGRVVAGASIPASSAGMLALLALLIATSAARARSHIATGE